MSRRFPPPWSVEETDACFIVSPSIGEQAATVVSRLAWIALGEFRQAALRSTAPKTVQPRKTHQRRPLSQRGAFCANIWVAGRGA